MNIEICNEIECIKNLEGTKKNNEIQLTWDWPELNTGIDYVYIFELYEEDETLYDLDKRNAKHFSIARKNYMENACYKKTIINNKIQYKIFPVKMDKSKTIVLNQLNNNITKTFYKSIVVEYSINEKINGSKKKVCFIFSTLDTIMNLTNNNIVYNKYDKNNKYICTYPLNIDFVIKNNYNIVVNRDEKLRLSSSDKNSDILKFYLK